MLPGTHNPPSGRSEVLIDRTLGTNIGDLSSNGGLAAAFDGNTNQAAAACAVNNSSGLGHVGKTLAAPAVFSNIVVHGSNNEGYINAPAVNAVLTLRGKQGVAPADRTDGTLLASSGAILHQADESAERTLQSSDTTTAWDHVWVQTAYSGGSASSFRIAEIAMYELK